MKYAQVFILAVCIGLIGCGSDDDSRFSDIYYIEENDTYLRFYEDNEVSKYKCTVNNGYQIDTVFSGIVTDSKIEVTWNGSHYDFTLEANEDGSELKLAEETAPINYLHAAGTLTPVFLPFEYSLSKEEEIPSACSSSAVNITYINPKSWMAGPNNTISVNFDYRAKTANNVEIQLAYMTQSAYGLKVGSGQVFDGMSQSSDTLTVAMKPEYSSNDIFGLYVLMYEVDDGIKNLISYNIVKISGVDLINYSGSSSNTDCLTCVAAVFAAPGPFD